MARATNDNSIKEKVGVASMSGHLAEISYIGGSMFEVNFPDMEGADTLQFDRSVMDQLISKRQVKLTSASRYDEICAAIQPDGSTKTHNANGTLKSQVSRTAGQLAAEGYIQGKQPQQDLGGDDGSSDEAPSRGNRGGTPGPFSRGESSGAPDDGGNPRSRNRDRQPAPQPEDYLGDEADDFPAFPDDDQQFSPQPRRQMQRQMEDGAAAPGPAPSSRRKKSFQGDFEIKQIPGDLNGDGVVDEMDDFVAEEQKKSPLVMGALFLAALASVVLFFVMFFVSSTILGHDAGSSLPAWLQPGQQQQEQPQQEQQQGQSEARDGQGGEGSGDGDGGSGGARETVVRTDYDPETVVKSFPMASEEQQKTAIAIFQVIRTDMLNGDVLSFGQAVDIERIAGEVAPAYAAYAAGEQNLGDAERSELEQSYRETFSRNERQHVVDKDTYASIFGGRIREVRQDPGNPLCMYVVMESIAGDHQRACFAINGDGNGGWTVTDLVDPEGYVKMIGTGNELFG